VNLTDTRYNYVNRYVRIIAYWFKVLHSNNCIVKADAANGKNNWASRVKTLLCSHGFPDVLITLMLLIANHSCVFLNNLYVMLLFNHGKVIKNLTKYYARSIAILKLHDFSYEIYLDKVTSPALGDLSHRCAHQDIFYASRRGVTDNNV